MNNPYHKQKIFKRYDDDLKMPIVKNIRHQEAEALYSIFKSNFKKNDTVLEIGAGTGYYTLEIARMVKAITCVEPSNGMLKILKKKIKQTNLNNIEIVQADFLKYKSKKQFDYVIAVGVLDYVENWEIFVNLALKFARKKVILTMPNRSFLGWVFEFISKLYNIKIYRYRKDQFKNILKNYQLNIFDAGGKTKITKGQTLIAVIKK